MDSASGPQGSSVPNDAPMSFPSRESGAAAGGTRAATTTGTGAA